jgi:hypothetical protein
MLQRREQRNPAPRAGDASVPAPIRTRHTHVDGRGHVAEIDVMIGHVGDDASLAAGWSVAVVDGLFIATRLAC